jgi:hypothetical protein
MTITEERPGQFADLDPDEVTIGTASGPGLWLAPAGTAPPATTGGNLGAFTTPWAALGYASDDGVTNGGDTTTEQITPWQSRTPIRTLVTERTRTVQFVLWQLNELTLGLYFDTVVPPPVSGVISFDVRSDQPQRIHAVAVDVLDGASQFRIVYPRATLDSTGDMAITKASVVPLDVTLSALDDAGVMAKIYYKLASGAVGERTIRSGGSGKAAA